MPLRKFKSQFLLPVALILAAAALAYLPNLLRATVYRDDWYYVLDRIIGGPGIFQAMFKIDRPARGPFFELYYQLFGVAPLPYHLASYVWRSLGGVSAFWLFSLLWPKQRRAGAFMALMFVLFPGYLRWMEGFEDQPRIASACLMALSFALTLKAISMTGKLAKAAAWIASVLTGWAYLGLLDFGIGMEVFRYLCVLVLIDGSETSAPILSKAMSAIRAWAIAALVPAGFLFWRLFIFHNERAQTDVGKQLGVFAGSPLQTAAVWLIRLVQSAADVSIFSWVTPALQQFFGLRLKDMLIGGALAVMVIAAVYLANYLLKKEISEEADTGEAEPIDRWKLQALWLGLMGVLIGVLPVIMANRYVDFGSYSHYALPASLAGAMFITALVFSFKRGGLAIHAIAFLAACAVLAHFAYSVQVVDEEQTISRFWQQVAWRAPNIKEQTTLFVNYPGVNYGDNIDAVDGPANFIYFPGLTDQIPATYQITALAQASKTTNDVYIGRDEPTGYRTHIGNIDYGRLLVISQPSPTACVHVINGQWPVFSSDDPDQIRLVGSYSRTENVLNSGRTLKLPATMFGPEPDHRWCYYFEKADLALQSGDWKKVAELGNEAAKAGLHAEDWVEWMPFLEANARLGDEASFTATAHRLNGDTFARLQACTILTGMQKSGQSFSPGIQSQISSLLCRGE